MYVRRLRRTMLNRTANYSDSTSAGAIAPDPSKAEDGVASVAAARCAGVQAKSDRRPILQAHPVNTDGLVIGYRAEMLCSIGKLVGVR